MPLLMHFSFTVYYVESIINNEFTYPVESSQHITVERIPRHRRTHRTPFQNDIPSWITPYDDGAIRAASN